MRDIDDDLHQPESALVLTPWGTFTSYSLPAFLAHSAKGQSRRFGSIASFRPDTDHFRSSPISSHFQSWLACLKGAITGLMHRSKMHYSITWSARSRQASEIVKHSAFAVFRLMISSNLVGRS